MKNELNTIKNRMEIIDMTQFIFLMLFLFYGAITLCYLENILELLKEMQG